MKTSNQCLIVIDHSVDLLLFYSNMAGATCTSIPDSILIQSILDYSILLVYPIHISGYHHMVKEMLLGFHMQSSVAYASMHAQAPANWMMTMARFHGLIVG